MGMPLIYIGGIWIWTVYKHERLKQVTSTHDLGFQQGGWQTVSKLCPGTIYDVLIIVVESSCTQKEWILSPFVCIISDLMMILWYSGIKHTVQEEMLRNDGKWAGRGPGYSFHSPWISPCCSSPVVLLQYHWRSATFCPGQKFSQWGWRMLHNTTSAVERYHHWGIVACLRVGMGGGAVIVMWWLGHTHIAIYT